ncbi:hypothetical protein V8C34DRAFT_266594 [Trichoderma compactum]
MLIQGKICLGHLDALKAEFNHEIPRERLTTIAKPLFAIRHWILFFSLPFSLGECTAVKYLLGSFSFWSFFCQLNIEPIFFGRRDTIFYANPSLCFSPFSSLPASMVFTVEMALNSSFASLLKELCAIENQFEPESPREDILQHGEDLQDVMASSTPQLDTSQASEQLCEKEGQGSSVREEERTIKEPKVESTPAKDENNWTWQGQWETVFPKSKAVARDLWYGVKGRIQRPPQSSHSNSSGTTVQRAPEERRGHHVRRRRKSQREEEDDWVVVADDFDILVFLDDY